MAGIRNEGATCYLNSVLSDACVAAGLYAATRVTKQRDQAERSRGSRRRLFVLVGRSKVPGCSESRGRPCAPRPARALPLPHRSPRSRPGPAAAVRDGDVVSRCCSVCTTSRRCGAWWTASTRPSQTPQDAYVPRAPTPPRPRACGDRAAGAGCAWPGAEGREDVATRRGDAE